MLNGIDCTDLGLGEPKLAHQSAKLAYDFMIFFDVLSQR